MRKFNYSVAFSRVVKMFLHEDGLAGQRGNAVTNQFVPMNGVGVSAIKRNINVRIARTATLHH